MVVLGNGRGLGSPELRPTGEANLPDSRGSRGTVWSFHAALTLANLSRSEFARNMVDGPRRIRWPTPDITAIGGAQASILRLLPGCEAWRRRLAPQCNMSGLAVRNTAAVVDVGPTAWGVLRISPHAAPVLQLPPPLRAGAYAWLLVLIGRNGAAAACVG
jgi:hypothetical protein